VAIAYKDWAIKIRPRMSGTTSGLSARSNKPARTPYWSPARSVVPRSNGSDSKCRKPGEQSGREGHEGYAEKKRQLQPRVVAITSCQQIQLRALANPEDAEGHETHRIDQHAWTKPHQLAPQVSFRASAQRRDGQAKDEQGHAHREDAVRDSGQSVKVRSGELVEAPPAAPNQIHPVRMTETIGIWRRPQVAVP
jgi:hypothetical protein